MKKLLLILLVPGFLLAAVRAEPSAPGQPSHRGIDATAQFIFFSVLEGLYETGLSNEDVDQILMKKENQSYFHFIYACPICTPTIWALQSYRARPDRFYGIKLGGGTFGKGLDKPLRDQLYSADSGQRLIAINSLVKDWIARRMDRMKLSEKERELLVQDLEKKRKEGMQALESFRNREHGENFGVEQAAPAYVDLEECAACNGAVGKVMKLPGAKAK